MLEKQLPACSAFENLETLEIGDWCLTDNFNIVLHFLQLSPRLKRLTLVQRELPKEAHGARVDAVPINGRTLKCPLLKTVVIRCSKDDGEIHKMVNALVVNGVSLEKISVTFYEDITEKVIGVMRRFRYEQEKEFAIFEKTLEENPEWVDDSNAGSSIDEEGTEDEDDDESEDEDDEDSDVEDDDSLEENGVDNNEDGTDDGLEGDAVDNNVDGNDGDLEDCVDNNEDGNDNDLEEDGIKKQ
ncbi:unnamed protein product [Urochloa humidicola]